MTGEGADDFMRTGPVRLVPSVRHGDARGWFSETYNRRTFDQLGIKNDFVQDNQSFSAVRFTLRGLHFQTPPHAQDKLVRCVRGRIFDAAVDVRAGSPSFGRWVAAELSAAEGNQLYIPAGFAHGFLTLEDNCEVAYKCSAFYAPSNEAGVRWDDPSIGIEWPLPSTVSPHLSEKDSKLPWLEALESRFPYDGCPLELTGAITN